MKKAAFALAIAAYFFFVASDGLRAPFAADDMLAIYTYWHPSPLRFLVSQFLLWRGYFRPMVGFFYLPVYARYGLNPLPYHALLLLLLLLGAWLMYRLAAALGAAPLAAAVVALIACYHCGLANLYYNTVYVGDVLCGIFYFAALGLYARVRSSGRLLNAPQTAAFLLLYLCALNSKEMAVTLPVLLLVYEWLYRAARPWPWPAFAAWLRGPGRAIFWAGILDVLSVYGKAFGRYGLMANAGYQPVYSWARFLDFEQRYLSCIFVRSERLDWPAVALLWLFVTYFAWRRPRPLLRFCWFYVVVAPLPIQFLVGRDQANLYVTLPGWAIFAATLFTDSLPAIARVLAGEPFFRRLRQDRLRALLAALGILLLAFATASYEKRWITLAIPQLNPLTAQVLAEFRAVAPRVPPASRVVFLDDPWPDGYDMVFIAELWFRDRKTQVALAAKQPLPPALLDQADAVFTWRAGRLVRLR